MDKAIVVGPIKIGAGDTATSPTLSPPLIAIKYIAPACLFFCMSGLIPDSSVCGGKRIGYALSSDVAALASQKFRAVPIARDFGYPQFLKAPHREPAVVAAEPDAVHILFL